MGFSFAAARYTNDVQLHADGRNQAGTVLQAMYHAVFVTASERRIL